MLANSEARSAVAPARRVLEAGGRALDAVEQGARAVEDDPGVVATEDLGPKSACVFRQEGMAAPRDIQAAALDG